MTTTSTMCGIILPNGKDCLGPVNQDAPLNLCDVHFAEAAKWVNENDETKREPIRCDECGERQAYPGTTGYHCTVCGYQSRDFAGSTRLSPRELEDRGKHGGRR